MRAKNKNLKSPDQFADEKIAQKGTENREQSDHEYDAFIHGVLIQQAKEQKGLTHEQLADLAGTNKSYIQDRKEMKKIAVFSSATNHQ